MNQWLQDSKRGKGFFRDHISEIIGIIASAVALLIFGADHFIIPALLLILLTLTILRKRLDDSEDEGPALTDHSGRDREGGAI